MSSLLIADYSPSGTPLGANASSSAAPAQAASVSEARPHFYLHVRCHTCSRSSIVFAFMESTPPAFSPLLRTVIITRHRRCRGGAGGGRSVRREGGVLSHRRQLVPHHRAHPAPSRPQGRRCGRRAQHRAWHRHSRVGSARNRHLQRSRHHIDYDLGKDAHDCLHGKRASRLLTTPSHRDHHTPLLSTSFLVPQLSQDSILDSMVVDANPLGTLNRSLLILLLLHAPVCTRTMRRTWPRAARVVTNH